MNEATAAAADLNRLMHQTLLLINLATPAAGAVRIGWSGFWHMFGKEEDIEGVIRKVFLGMAFVYGAEAFVAIFRTLIRAGMAVIQP